MLKNLVVGAFLVQGPVKMLFFVQFVSVQKFLSIFFLNVLGLAMFHLFFFGQDFVWRSTPILSFINVITGFMDAFDLKLKKFWLSFST